MPIMRNIILDTKKSKWYSTTKYIERIDVSENMIVIFDISVSFKPDLMVCASCYDMDKNIDPSDISFDLEIMWGLRSMDPDVYEWGLHNMRFTELDTYNKLFSICPFIQQALNGLSFIGMTIDSYDYMGEDITINLYVGNKSAKFISDMADKDFHKRMRSLNLLSDYYRDTSLDIIFLLKKSKFDIINLHISSTDIELDNSILEYMKYNSKDVKFILIPIAICYAHVCVTPNELYWLLRIEKVVLMVEFSDYTAEERALCDDSILELERNNITDDDEIYDLPYEFTKHIVGFDFNIAVLVSWLFAITNEITYLCGLVDYDVYLASMKLAVTIDDTTIDIYIDEKDIEHFSPWVTIKQLIKEIDK